MLEEYIQKNFISKGMCADYAIHNDKENNNPHAHVMLTMREIENSKFSSKKIESGIIKIKLKYGGDLGQSQLINIYVKIKKVTMSRIYHF